jgi:hypothetical protein
LEHFAECLLQPGFFLFAKGFDERTPAYPGHSAQGDLVGRSGVR